MKIFLQVIATDLDESSPNNDISISFNAGCPLESMEQTYTPENGGNVTITFLLTDQVDYDTMDDPSIQCTGTISVSAFLILGEKICKKIQ